MFSDCSIAVLSMVNLRKVEFPMFSKINWSVLLQPISVAKYCSSYSLINYVCICKVVHNDSTLFFLSEPPPVDYFRLRFFSNAKREAGKTLISILYKKKSKKINETLHELQHVCHASGVTHGVVHLFFDLFSRIFQSTTRRACNLKKKVVCRWFNPTWNRINSTVFVAASYPLDH